MSLSFDAVQQWIYKQVPAPVGESAFISAKMTTDVSKATVASFSTLFSVWTSGCHSARYLVSFLMLWLKVQFLQLVPSLLSCFVANSKVIFVTSVVFRHVSTDLFVRVPSLLTLFYSLICSLVSYNEAWLV